MKFKQSYWFVVIGVFFIVATNIVFIRLYLETPSKHQYTGIGFEADADKLVYYSMINQGFEGRLLMQNIHTSEQQRGALFSPHWYIVGMMSRLFDISTPAAYHVFRILGTIIFLVLFERFLRLLFSDTLERLGSYIIALFASGLGWFYYLLHPEIGRNSEQWWLHFNSTPPDLYVTEMIPFLNCIQSVLFILSYICIVFILYLSIKSQDTVSKLPLYGIGLVTTALLLIHPYDAPLLLGITGTIWVLQSYRKGLYPWRSFVGVVVGCGIALGYHVWSFSSEPALAGWLEQNITFSPNIPMFLWALGVLTPLAVIGLAHLVLRKQQASLAWLVVVTWACMVPLMIYLPTVVNRRFTNTWFIPLSLLAYQGIVWIISSIRAYITRVAILMCIGILLFSGTLYNLAQYVWYQPSIDEKYNYYLDPYISDFLIQAKPQLTYEDVVLANQDYISMLFTGFIRTKVYLGHAHQTAQYPQKRNTVEWFFAHPQGANGIERRIQFLKEAGITYIAVYKPSMSTSFEWIDALPGVKRVYDSIILRMYMVNQYQ